MKRRIILILGCDPRTAPIILQLKRCENFDVITSEYANSDVRLVKKQGIGNDIDKLIKSFTELSYSIEDFKIKIHEELPKEPIIHGYQNPRNTITLSSRGKFSRKCHKKRKRR